MNRKRTRYQSVTPQLTREAAELRAHFEKYGVDRELAERFISGKVSPTNVTDEFEYKFLRYKQLKMPDARDRALAHSKKVEKFLHALGQPVEPLDPGGSGKPLKTKQGSSPRRHIRYPKNMGAAQTVPGFVNEFQALEKPTTRPSKAKVPLSERERIRPAHTVGPGAINRLITEQPAPKSWLGRLGRFMGAFRSVGPSKVGGEFLFDPAQGMKSYNSKKAREHFDAVAAEEAKIINEFPENVVKIPGSLMQLLGTFGPEGLREAGLDWNRRVDSVNEPLGVQASPYSLMYDALFADNKPLGPHKTRRPHIDPNSAEGVAAEAKKQAHKSWVKEMAKKHAVSAEEKFLRHYVMMNLDKDKGYPPSYKKRLLGDEKYMQRKIESARDLMKDGPWASRKRGEVLTWLKYGGGQNIYWGKTRYRNGAPVK